MKSKLKNFLVIALSSCFLFFCTSQQNSFPPITREKEKKSDPAVQKTCQETPGKECSPECKDTCNDLFSRTAHRKSCKALPDPLVSDFKKLIKNIEDGNLTAFVQSADALKCLMDIDEKPVALAVRKLDSSTASDFMKEIRKNKNISNIFNTEDDEHNVFRQMLAIMGDGDSPTTSSVFTKLIDGKPLITFLSSTGTDAVIFKWMDDYISGICSGDECPLSFYCEVFLALNNDQQTEFISEASLFAEKYRATVEKKAVPGSAENGSESYFAFKAEGSNNFASYCRLLEPCTNLEESACTSKANCRWGAKVGQCTDSSLSDYDSCSVISGCSWSADAACSTHSLQGACEGITGCSWEATSPCSSQDTQNSCQSTSGCSWQASSCSAQSAETDCKAVSGCSWSPNSACFIQISESACEAISGCNWDSREGITCNIPNETVCKNVNGCRWANGRCAPTPESAKCKGTPSTSCSAHSTGVACKAVSGCSWSAHPACSSKSTESACDNASGCNWSANPACSSKSSQAACGGVSGCSWSANPSCSSKSTQSSCGRISGCSWSANPACSSKSSQAACSSVSGCSWSQTSCSSKSTESACNNVSGCSWGEASPCYMQTSESTCKAISGCRWANSGLTCLGLSETLCKNMERLSGACKWKNGKCNPTPEWSKCKGTSRSTCNGTSSTGTCSGSSGGVCSGNSGGTCSGNSGGVCGGNSGGTCSGNSSTGTCSGSSGEGTCSGESSGGICSGEPTSGTCGGTPESSCLVRQ